MIWGLTGSMSTRLLSDGKGLTLSLNNTCQELHSAPELKAHDLEVYVRVVMIQRGAIFDNFEAFLAHIGRLARGPT